MTDTGVNGPRDAKDPGVCVHGPCTCTVTQEQGYFCSEACQAAADAGDDVHAGCGCGHDSCQASAKAS